MITGKEALIALSNGDKLQAKDAHDWKDVTWDMPLAMFDTPMIVFRLKPHTITLNGIEAPAPFEPKHGEIFWHIDVREICSYNYKQEWSDSDEYLQLGAWRTESEIKQVVAALRSIFK